MRVVLAIRGADRQWSAYEFERPPTDEEERHHYSFAKFCPHCCEIWATIQYGEDTFFTPDSGSCELCSLPGPSGFNAVPGSLLDRASCHRSDEGFLEYLPLDLVRREFELHERRFLGENKANVDSRPVL